MRILLTGPSGFLGANLAAHWIGKGYELGLIARQHSQLNHLKNLDAFARIFRVATHEEITNAVYKFTPNIVVHTACAYGRKGEKIFDILNANHLFGSILLQAALEISKSNLTDGITFINTGTALKSDVSLYALTKTQFSEWGSALASQTTDNLKFIDIKLQQMYGPGDDQSKFTTHVIEACKRNDPYLALTKGEQLRDFIHIDDVVSAYDLIVNQRENFKKSDSIDVGTGECISMRSFVELVKEISGASTRLDFGAVPYRVNEPAKCVADVHRLLGLGWKPQKALCEALKQIIRNSTD
jgi:CDP-paratose synthetase